MVHYMWLCGLSNHDTASCELCTAYDRSQGGTVVSHLKGFKGGNLCDVDKASALDRQASSRYCMLQLFPGHDRGDLAGQLVQGYLMTLHTIGSLIMRFPAFAIILNRRGKVPFGCRS